ncbi:integrase [Bradyrhizobium diazoefficiens]
MGPYSGVCGGKAKTLVRIASPTSRSHRLVKRAAVAAGVRGDLPEGEREEKFAGHSLRAGLASSAEVDERYVQKQLGHASAEMTRRYQRRRDRFRVNLTKAAGR